jgi:hypothetical protein
VTNGVVPLTAAAEGAVDGVVLRRVMQSAGAALATIYDTRGVSNLVRRLPGFNAAAEYAPWIVLMDLDRANCAPELITKLLPTPSSQMRFRIAVRTVEAWLLGDSERFATFFSVPKSKLPLDPEAIADPKQAVVNLANHSKRRAIREDLLPVPGSGRRVGPGYEARMIEFVIDPNGWRPEVAATRSDSLLRCIEALD